MLEPQGWVSVRQQLQHGCWGGTAAPWACSLAPGCCFGQWDLVPGVAVCRCGHGACGMLCLQPWVLLSMGPVEPQDRFRSIPGTLSSHKILGRIYSEVFSVVHCKWLRHSVLTVIFPGFEGLVPSLVVCVVPGVVAWTQLTKDSQRKVPLGAVGQIIPRGNGADLVETKGQ